MALKDTIARLANEKKNICVTISLNTHRTHPDNQKDFILLKNLIKEAENRLVEEYGKGKAMKLIDKFSKIPEKIDVRMNLDSLHIFIAEDTEEIIRIAWPTYENKVQLAETFDLRSLIKAYNRSEEYLILLLSRGGVHLYDALNDTIVDEIKNEDFPFPANPHYLTSPTERSNTHAVDNQILEFFNTVDKAVVKMYNEAGLYCIVVCTEDNYSYLRKVADKPEIYQGYTDIDYNNTKPHQIVKRTWEVVKCIQVARRTEAINEAKESISEGKLITDLQEIYQASLDGRGDTLIVYEDFVQPVVMTDARNFEYAKNSNEPDAIDDITSDIAWEVLSKKGKVFFTKQEEIKELGDIALKVRY